MPNSHSKSSGSLFDKTTVTLLVAGLAAIGLTGLIVSTTPRKVPTTISQHLSQLGTPAVTSEETKAAANAVWATSAPGRVEPKGGEVDLRAEASGRIAELYAAMGERVRKGDLLVRLRDDTAAIRIRQAEAETDVRLRERDEEPEKNKLMIERRNAADELAAAERELHKSKMAFDDAYITRRKGGGSDAALNAAREAITKAEAAVSEKSSALEVVKAKTGMPLPTRLDSGLTLARADLRLAEIALENTRVHAPADGTLLRFDAKIGEMAAPNQQQPLAVLGDMSSIQITAEVPERDVSKVRLGQAVIVRSSAFAGMEFTGKVIEIAPSVRSPGLRAQGPRQQLDAEVLEVKIAVDGNPPVMPGMRVDVFFKSEQRVSSVLTHKE